MTAPIISIFCPSRGRNRLLGECVKSVFERAKRPEQVEFLVMFDEDDTGADKFVEANLFDGVKVHRCKRSEWMQRDYNNALASRCAGKFLWVFNDECEIVTQDWDEKIEECVEMFCFLRGTRVVYVGMNDSTHYRESEMALNFGCTFPILTREGYERLGCFFPPEIRMWGADIALYRIFRGAGRPVVWVRDVQVLHKSHHNGWGGKDRTARRVEKISQTDTALTAEQLGPYVRRMMG